ncbi:hypothetical protein ACFUNF_27325 [Streptomyces sp. NPDC057291]|uniref:hypothetical protein n=1 Tax=Streptomyces sp. NPDC057291 TaxID=3346087 RepID=UPI0036346542
MLVTVPDGRLADAADQHELMKNPRFRLGFTSVARDGTARLPFGDRPHLFVGHRGRPR